MAEGYIDVTEGSGKKVHTFYRVIGGNSLEDHIVVLGEPYYPTYTVAFQSIAITTGNQAIIQLLLPSESTKRLRIRKLAVRQEVLASTASYDLMAWVRSSSPGAGSNSTAVHAYPLDPRDVGSDAEPLTLLATAPGSWTSLIGVPLPIFAAEPNSCPGWTWEQLPNEKPIIIDPGEAIILVNGGAQDGSASVSGNIEWDELTY